MNHIKLFGLGDFDGKRGVALHFAKQVAGVVTAVLVDNGAENDNLARAEDVGGDVLDLNDVACRHDYV